jgi:hypothetical protein
MLDVMDKEYQEAYHNMVKFASIDKNQIEDHIEEEKKERKKPKKTQAQIFLLPK